MSTPNRINAIYDRGDKKIDIVLSLLYWIEDGVHFFYAPALDLTGYGNSEAEARKSLEITLHEFVDYTDNKKTIYAELERLGWTTNKRKRRVSAPSEEDLLAENETYHELANRPDVSRTSSNFAMPL